MSCTSQASIHAPQVGSLLGFTGQPRDPLTGCYHLGNGHRTYNPVLMRFHSADRLSPFGKGGINAYAYCQNDPVNYHDPSGRFPSWLGPVRSVVGGFVNLAISAVKAYRGYVTRNDFNRTPEFSGSREGNLTFGTAENPVLKWSTQDTMLTAFGAFSATVSIGTGIGRMAASNSNALMWTDTTVSMIATALSGYELYTLATASVVRRYPVEVKRFQPTLSPVSSATNVRETVV